MKRLMWFLLIAGFLLAGSALAARVSNIAKTKHNLSTSSSYTVKATSESQICVFCHTPHGATSIDYAPLWNRDLVTAATYTGNTYDSSSIETIIKGELAAGPGGTSKLCLSCHDGTMAIGSVNVLNGQQNVTINLSGGVTTMPGGAGATTGFTRNLGTDLTNDHPISFTLNSDLATADGELRTPPFSTGTPSQLVVGNRQGGQSGANKPLLPLDANKVQCTTCHDPHLWDDSATYSTKFLRLNRLQKTQPVGSSFDPGNDIVCLACHDKGKNNWASSSHAREGTGSEYMANEQYKDTEASRREFPTGIQVWEGACLNCHDTHTVIGSRRLLREGTDDASVPKAGGNSAIEETCYQCHASSSDTILNTGLANYDVPDLKSEFEGTYTAGTTYNMPITTAEQPATSEVHDIQDADFTESTTKLGKGALTNRHVECTDCHNPHRLMKNQLFEASGASTARTHRHDTGAQHSNLASGALRGTFGVEPVYGSGTAWMTRPSSYDVKKGDGITTTRASTHVTREYQVCLKCHSDYAYNDDNVYPTSGTRPALGSFSGGTPAGTNGLNYYTNQAMEFAAAANDSKTGGDQGEPGGNHRSWHPVIWPTGRTLSVRNAGNLWLSPFNRSSGADVGNLTMYCTDCHGSNTASGSTTPASGRTWGPHTSTNPFILKGPWNTSTGSGQQEGLCFKCHSYTNYATKSGGSSGFGGSKDSNLHQYHADRIGSMRCNWCHIAVPHGWKNKALLVNLNDVGPEAGLAAGTQVRNKTTTKYNRGPYYMDAINKILTWSTSGSWSDSNCGSKGMPGNGASGKSWMRDSTENCANP